MMGPVLVSEQWSTYFKDEEEELTDVFKLYFLDGEEQEDKSKNK